MMQAAENEADTKKETDKVEEAPKQETIISDPAPASEESKVPESTPPAETDATPVAPEETKAPDNSEPAQQETTAPADPATQPSDTPAETPSVPSEETKAD